MVLRRRNVGFLALLVLGVAGLILWSKKGPNVDIGHDDLERTQDHSRPQPAIVEHARSDSAYTPDVDAQVERLDSPPARQESTALVADVTVVVETADGTALIDAGVWLIAESPVDVDPPDRLNPTALLSDLQVATATTDTAGHAVLAVPEGRFLAVVRKVGFAPQHQWIDVGLNSTTSFRMKRSVGLQGRVIDGNSKSPISGASIVVFPQDRADGRARDWRTLLDRVVLGERVFAAGDGKFRCEEVAEERLELHCFAPGYPPIMTFLWPEGQEVLLELSGHGTATGHVFDTEGQPIDGVGVACWLRGKVPVTKAADARTTTDGSFVLSGLPSGGVTFTVAKEGYALTKVFRTLVDGEPGLMEFLLEPEIPLNGTVVDEAGKPVAKAKVRVFDRTVDAELGFMDSEDDGRWWMHWVPAGHRIDINVEHKEHAFASYCGVALDGEPVEIVLRSYWDFFGRVTDESGSPVRAFSILDLPHETTTEEEIYLRGDDDWEDFSDLGGRFKLAGRWPSSHELQVRAPGFVPTTFTTESARREGDRVGPLEFQLRRGDAITGRVVSMSGVPLTGVRLLLAGASLAGVPCDQPNRTDATTGPEGSFTIAGVPELPFSLLVGGGGWPLHTFRELRREEFPRDFVLAEPGAIAGHVNVPWRDPSSVVEVNVFQSGTWIGRTVAPDPAGDFRVEGLAPGPFDVTLIDKWGRWEAGGDYVSTTTVEVRSKEVAEVELTARPGFSVDGIVHFPPSSGSIHGSRVVLHDAGAPGNPIATAYPKLDGHFGFASLAAGRFTVNVEMDRPGLLIQESKEIELSPAHPRASVEIDVSVPKLRGRVLDEQDQPVDAVVTLVERANGRMASASRVDATGAYAIASSLAGEFVAWVNAPGFAEDWSQMISLPAVEADEILHRLSPESRLVVTVVDDQGVGIGDAEVRLVVDGRPQLLPALVQRSNSLGGSRFTRLPASRSVCSAHSAGHDEVTGLPVHLDVGATRELRIVLARLSALEVRCPPLRKGEVRPARLKLASADRAAAEAREASLEGRDSVLFDALPPGAYRITSDLGDEVAVTLRAGERQVVELGRD